MKKTVTINYNETILEVVGGYEPFEQGVMYDSNMEGIPDYPATFEVYKILDEYDNNVIEDYDEDDLESIELLCLDSI